MINNQSFSYRLAQSIRPLRVNLPEVVFYTVFLLAFMLSGLITMLDIIPYRMGAVSLIVLSLMVWRGPRVDLILLVYLALGAVVLLSALYNDTSITQFLLFTRILLFSYLIYYLVATYVRRENIARIIQVCVAIAVIQLPVILFQRATYEMLPGYIRQGMNLWAIDYDFGTFNFKGDNAMTFFIVLLIIFLLFDNHRSRIIPYRIPIIIWLTVTVLITNSDISKIILLCIWAIYIATHLTRKLAFYLLVLLVVVLLVLGVTGILSGVIDTLTYRLEKTAAGVTSGRGVEVYLAGGYARGAAIYYYLHSDILWLGDGPSVYSDPIDRNLVRGNTGHIFTFYSEVGLIAWLLSSLVFFLIAVPIRGWQVSVRSVGLLAFFAVQVLSFTTQIMNDISVFLIYCIIAYTHLIPIDHPETG